MKLIWAVLSSAVIVLSTVFVPAFNPVFKTVPLDLKSMLIVFGFVLAVPFVSGIIGIFKTKH